MAARGQPVREWHTPQGRDADRGGMEVAECGYGSVGLCSGHTE